MSADAILMLTVAIVCVWGGLVVAVINLRRSDASRDGASGRPSDGRRRGGRHVAP